MSKTDTQIGFRVTSEFKARLEAQARRERRPVSNLILKAAYLGRREIPAGLSPCVKRYHETASRGAPYAAPAKLSLLFRERFLRKAFTFFCGKTGF